MAVRTKGSGPSGPPELALVKSSAGAVARRSRPKAAGARAAAKKTAAGTLATTTRTEPTTTGPSIVAKTAPRPRIRPAAGEPRLGTKSTPETGNEPLGSCYRELSALLDTTKLDQGQRAHAAIALVLASKLDESQNSDTGTVAMAISGIAKELRATLDWLTDAQGDSEEFAAGLFA
jgi:hypothetical protein